MFVLRYVLFPILCTFHSYFLNVRTKTINSLMLTAFYFLTCVFCFLLFFGSFLMNLSLKIYDNCAEYSTPENYDNTSVSTRDFISILSSLITKNLFVLIISSSLLYFKFLSILFSPYMKKKSAT